MFSVEEEQRAFGNQAEDPHASPTTCPRVSVCIVNRNCKEHLERCLRSLLEQTQGVPFEIIVVDNGSTDGAADMTASLFPCVTLIRNTCNLGFSRANNQAAERARGTYLFFLNNDTIIPAGTLAEMAETQENHPDAWLIGPRMRGMDGAIQRGPRRLPRLNTFLHRTFLFRLLGIFKRQYSDYCRQHAYEDRPKSVEVLMGAALWVQRERFHALGGWDEEFFFGGEDMELCLRAARYGTLLHTPNVEIIHVGRQSTRQFISQASIHIAVGFVKYLRKSGVSRLGILTHKIAVTLDTPPQLLLKVGQLVWRLCRGQKAKATKCWNDLKGLCSFLVKGLIPFWSA